MTKALRKLEALFGAENLPADPSGILSCVALAYTSTGLESIAILQESGEVLAFHTLTPGSWGHVEIEDAARRFLSRAADSSSLHTWPDRRGGVGAAASCTIQGQRYLLLAHFRKFDEQNETERSAFTLTAEIVLRAIATFAEISEQRSRVLHLRNEQEMLAASHQRIVAELIEARQEQTRKEREYVAILESEISKRSEQVRLALRRAQLASEAKGSFLSNMSHEIRMPMTAVLGYSDLLLDGDASATDIVEYARLIRWNGEHVLQVLNDVLDISRIESNKISIEKLPCDPRLIVEDVVSALRPTAEERGIELAMEFAEDVPETVATDPIRLRQILMNLVENALTFTESGSVRLCVRQESRENGKVLEIDVVDTGMGMSDAQVARLFQPFFQTDSTMTRRLGGTGLRLTISKSLTELLGGSLCVTSSPGAGSTFHVSVPSENVEDVVSVATPAHKDR